MDDRTLKALKGSIAHWRRVEADWREPVNVDTCHLCRKFHALGCEGCPVSAKTGQAYCGGTPYEHYRARDPNEAHRRAAARAEREFLESLLPVEGYGVPDDVYLPPAAGSYVTDQDVVLP